MNIEMNVELCDFPVVDMHLHLPVAQDDWLAPWRERYIAQNGRERYGELTALGKTVPGWLPEFCFPAPEEPMEDPAQAGERWYRECERFALERVVFMTGGGNETLSAVVAAHPDRFSGFAHHYIGERDAAQKLERAVTAQGLCGYKILAPVVEKPLSSPEYADVFEVCHRRRLPVLVHFGILGGGGGCGIVSGPNLSPLALAETAQRFPHAKFIVPHFGCGFPDELLTLCWASPNVYVDTSGNNLWTRWTMQRYTLEQLFERFYATVGPGRILFGSDSEWFPRGFAVRYLMDQLRAARGLNLPKADIQRIFRENALEMLGM